MNGSFFLPSGSPVRFGKTELGYVELRGEKTDYQFFFDPDSLRMTREWHFDRKKNFIRIAPENFSGQKVVPGKEYRLRVEVRFASEREADPGIKSPPRS